MRTLGIVVLVCASCAGATAFGEITKWGGDGTGYSIDPIYHTILITSSGTYKFQSITNGQPDDINEITVAPDVQGVALYVTPDPNQGYTYGARDVKLINLSTAAGRWLHGVKISGNLGESGLSTFNTIHGDPTSPFEVGGDLLGNLATTDPNAAACVIGDVTIGGQLSGSIEANSFGNITVNGTNTHTGSITGHSDYAGTISIAGPMNGNITFSHNSDLWLQTSITIDGDFNGHFVAEYAYCIDPNDPNDPNRAFDFHVTGDVGNTNPNTLIKPGALGDYHDPNHAGGTVRIDGDFVGGQIDVWSPNVPLRGSIQIAGDCGGRIHCGNNVVGSIEIGGSILDNDPNDLDPNNLDPNKDNLQIDGIVGSPIQIGGDCAGRIHFKDDLNAVLRINGSLYPNNADPNSYEIKIDGTLGTAPGYGGSVAVDYDGWDADQDWLPAARILVGTNPAVSYTGNDPNMHLWHITNCRGDMNNDGAVDFADINPFVDALNDPNNLTSYRANFPGLDGSVIYHGDCNANGSFGFDDINAFVALVLGEICDPNGWQEDEESEESELSAAAVATFLSAHVSASRQAALLSVLAGAAEYYEAEDSPRAELWNDVYDLLNE